MGISESVTHTEEKSTAKMLTYVSTMSMSMSMSTVDLYSASPRPPLMRLSHRAYNKNSKVDKR